MFGIIRCLKYSGAVAGRSCVGAQILYCHESTRSNQKRDRQFQKKNEVHWKPKLIIFDKNGTLFNFQATWSPWIQSFCKRLTNATGLPLTEQLYRKLDVCIYTNKTRSGILGHGTDSQVKQEIVSLLVESGVSVARAPSIVEKCWEESDADVPKEFIEYTNLKKLFIRLKQQGMKIAVCTADNRETTDRDFGRLEVLDCIDSSICGDDEGAYPKPDIRNIQQICSDTGVSTHDTVIVGDTEADVKMGYDAGLGLTVGVLSGIGTRLDLAQYSDYIFDDVTEFVHRVLPKDDAAIESGEEGPLVKRLRGSLNNSKTKASLIIFDKDGTLLCFNSMWTPWAMKLINRLEQETGLNLKDQVMEELGFDSEEQKWQPGVLAEGTQYQTKQKVKDLLHAKGIDETKAWYTVEKGWEDADQSKSENDLRLLDDPRYLFTILKENGIKIAICTSDSRAGTLDFVKSMGAEDLIDLVVCGDDPQAIPKPSPQNAIEICRTLGVHPSRAVMVGDTYADMGMGKSAKLGATVAVLSGVGNVEQLDDSADHVIPSISHLLPILFETGISTDSQVFNKSG